MESDPKLGDLVVVKPRYWKGLRKWAGKHFLVVQIDKRKTPLPDQCWVLSGDEKLVLNFDDVDVVR